MFMMFNKANTFTPSLNVHVHQGCKDLKLWVKKLVMKQELKCHNFWFKDEAMDVQTSWVNKEAVTTNYQHKIVLLGNDNGWCKVV